MRRTINLLPSLALLLLASACATGPAPDTADNTYQVYYLGGQSNMEGFGYVADLSADMTGPVPRVMIFTAQMTPDQQPVNTLGTWTPLVPGHGTGFKSNGSSNQLSDRFGPELLFGRTLSDLNPDARVAIIKYAFGGTALAHGAGFGNWDPDSRDGHQINQYDHALAAIDKALSVTDIDGDGRADRMVPAGIVWMQGEADAHDSPRTANAYRGNLERMMNLLRAALRKDDLPVVIGKITDSGMDEDGQLMHYIETVQQAQADFVAADGCAAYVTVTDSLAYLEDGWHYDSEGFIRMGAAFAKAMHGLQQRCPPQY